MFCRMRATARASNARCLQPAPISYRQATPEARSSLRIVRRNVELEARLIDDLLDLTRVNRGKLHMVSEVVAVHELIRTAIETAAREEAEAKQINLALALEAEHDEVWGDPVRLQQVIWNLLRNAVKFTQPGGRIEVQH